MIEKYKTNRPAPLGMQNAASEFARAIVAGLAPPTIVGARNYLSQVSGLALWCQYKGLALKPETVFHQSNVERYVQEGLENASLANKRTARAALRHVGRAVVPNLWPAEPKKYGRSPTHDPYTRNEIASYLRLADALPTEHLRLSFTAIVAGGAGAGLHRSDWRHIRGVDIVCDLGRVVASVPGRDPRRVPVLEPLGQTLLGVARQIGSGYLAGGSNPDRKNLTSEVTLIAQRYSDLPRLDVPRLRNTWLVWQLEHLGVRALMEAAGVHSSTRVWELLKYIKTPTAAEVASTLRPALS